ncbi:hypothetical protein EDB84DRAFT_1668352 [Lactarius hengduanensis]|nr:hypothetical protein EDB84DRAFT_1668352 [Lactarius hengduanensis]
MSSHEAEAVVGNLHEYDTTRPHSFDLTLELERQLEAESLPTSPARPVGRPQSLDTHVLASLVTSLRSHRAREADLASEVRQLRDSQAERDLELAALRQKIREDEESIVLLRSKVEESRRGLMRLQTESRRVSRGGDLSVDLSRASSLSFGGPSSAKRMSFTPLTGTSAARMHSHRRISSVSDTNVNWSDVTGGQTTNSSPNSQIITLPETSPQPGYLPTNNRRISGLFGRPVASESEPVLGLNPVEREKLQGEILALKSALEETRHDLMEVTEAREASETCVKTLRDFIAENNVGVPSVRGTLRPAATTRTRRMPSGNGGSRWGFGGLFRAGEASSPVLPSRGTSATASPQAASEPLSRKLGGLFSGRGSFSSSTSAPVRGIPVVQEAMYNSSDTSSTAESAEPASPSIDTSHVPIARVLSGASSTSSELVPLRNVSEETEIPGKNAAEVLVVRQG